ncbi:MAG: DUF5077 domain-containing protein, partial [Bacteroidia bacterium]|nr:DUF5077 domain-containing protein [Bacteroidia bacterium]
MRNLALLLTLTISLLTSNCRFDNKNVKMISIPASGNSWIINKSEKNEKIITGSGIANWKDPEDIIRTYFYTDKAGPLLIGFRVKTDTGSSAVRVTSGDITRMIKVKNTEYD